MYDIPEIDISQYHYDLPGERIARYPLPERDGSKLLVYKNGVISENLFRNIHGLLPKGSLMILNKTKVVQARLFFRKETGATIEILCIEPVLPSPDYQIAFAAKSPMVWKCMVGNSKRWKNGALELKFILDGKPCRLIAKRMLQEDDHSLVEFNWSPDELIFSDVLSAAGIVPLPPYLNREAEEMDPVRYQTVYALHEGSVAAPTAGLHFTGETFRHLKSRHIGIEEVTLHVGAGTFKPVKARKIADHEMHTEHIAIGKKTIESLLDSMNKPKIIVGTTTMRTLESLYWHGVRLLLEKESSPEIHIWQWDAYELARKADIPPEEALGAVLEKMHKDSMEWVGGQTQLLIMPGYQFRIADILVTNFHMPQSTLLLLVAAFIGNDWQKAYQYALDNDFRFLSYGDSCLFFKNPDNLQAL
ncbi:MAG: S-adenosylmethionine:tRNA ribosyltransferase-isomerase [Bacteroidales bacterium]|nr:S-adenosylmethionine:tRNA ribosyltransferase-isomerase [Bacteroidales bacterium]